jgi:hypothetical protein
VPADIAVPADVEGQEEFSTPMSKKDKKDKRNFVVTWEPDAFHKAMERMEQKIQGRARPSNTRKCLNPRRQ